MVDGRKTSSLIVMLLAAVVVVFGECPVGDLDVNCRIDFKDVSLCAAQWLADANSTADFSGGDGVSSDERGFEHRVCSPSPCWDSAHDFTEQPLEVFCSISMDNLHSTGKLHCDTARWFGMIRGYTCLETVDHS